MNIFDPNGSIRAYRIERTRVECYHSILWGVGFGCALVFLTCGVFVVLSLIGK